MPGFSFSASELFDEIRKHLPEFSTFVTNGGHFLNLTISIW